MKQGTPEIYRRIYDVIKRIPKGKVATYGHPDARFHLGRDPD